MKFKQLSVFLENQKGRLAQVVKLLSENEINIKSLFLADTRDFGVLRLLVNTPEQALSILKEHQFITRETEVMAVEVPDQPGGLYTLLDLFDQNNVNVEYMYAFVEKIQENAIMIFKLDDYDTALAVLKKHNFPVITDNILEKI